MKTNRRVFLKQAGIAGAATVAAGGCSASRNLAAASMSVP